MATKYIDVAAKPGITAVPAPSDTSTVTNKVRVSWDTTISRNELYQTLREIADAAQNPNVVPSDAFAGG